MNQKSLAIILLVVVVLLLFAGIVYAEVHGWTTMKSVRYCSDEDVGKIRETAINGSQMFKDYSNPDSVYFGTFPSFENDSNTSSTPDCSLGKEVSEWWYFMERLRRSVEEDPEFQKLTRKNGGLIIGAVHKNGILFIRYSDSDGKMLSSNDIEKIYQLIETKAEEEGFSDIPVVFTTRRLEPILILGHDCYTCSYEKKQTLSGYFKDLMADES
ncbi:hypothetical protein [Methanolapillus ohkumae]|uniref:Uncharacterized protein n=1 Tax=Methanolapillus ohkumae TaxID=3028298 RepID=A0AA96ZXB4_9EURY|nr:hypothetical protein MsAm2_06380 [Methanosarcinaceae archaeon Am2]